MSVSLLLAVLGWAAGWLAFGRPRRLDELPTAAAGRRTGLRGVSVVVPARNEEANIDHLLSGLCDPGDPVPGPDRIVVVDDHSSDRTAAIAAEHPGVEVVDAPPLPEHWNGKSWACHTGVAHLGGSTGNATAEPDGSVLVFLDADVRLDRAALAQVVAVRDRQGGLVSVQPWHETERRYEQLSCLFNVLAVMGTAMGSRQAPTGAFGPVLVSSRTDYDAVGGHASVRGELVEDLALADRYSSHGLPVEVLEGGHRIRFRMYPTGIRQLVEGWTKNFALGARSTGPVRLAAVVLWVTSLGSAAFALDDALRGAGPRVAGIALYCAFVAQLWVLFRRVGRFGPLTAVLYPVPLAFFVAVFARSLWRTHVRHNVTWRGREISTAAERG